MNNEKRQRSRVQGGWATAGPRPSFHPNVRKPQTPLAQPVASQGNCPAAQALHLLSHNEGRLEPARNKPELPTATAWAGTHSDLKQEKQTFVFQDPQEEIKVKPPDQTIIKPGVHDISTEPSGVSRLRYFPGFVDPSRRDKIFAELLDEIHWTQRFDIHNGVQAIQPRLVAWYSDLPYTYGGQTVEANTSEWPQCLRTLNQQLKKLTGIEFNALAANLYRDGHDSIGWHSDDEPIMGKNPIIASLSFGEERVFELRKKPSPSESGERDYTYSQVIRLPLRSGDLLIMEGWTQSDWQHRVPKEYHDRGARINITFRVAKPTGKNR